MESNLVVLETPELQKTIEELNDEIEPKIFSTNLGIENKPRELSLTEIYDIFNTERPKPSIFNYTSEPKTFKQRDERIIAIEKELLSIGESLKLKDDSDPDYKELSEEYAELEKILDKIKENSQAVNKKHSFSSTNNLKYTKFPDSFNNNSSFELLLTDVEERIRYNRLENKVRELEFVLGIWKQTRSVSDVLSEFFAKTKFINLDLLERTKDQAKHLGTDLDILLSTDFQSNTGDNTQAISDLYHDTYNSLANIAKLSLYIDRLAGSPMLFDSHSQLAKNLLNLEVSSENILGKTSQSILALEQITQGMPENRENISKSIGKLKKKIKK